MSGSDIEYLASEKGSPTPDSSTMRKLLHVTKIKSFIVDDVSAKCVGSVISCVKLNCLHMLLIFDLD